MVCQGYVTIISRRAKHRDRTLSYFLLERRLWTNECLVPFLGLRFLSCESCKYGVRYRLVSARHPIVGSRWFSCVRPFFDRVTIQLPLKENQLVIESLGGSGDKIYVESLSLNGRPMFSPILTHGQIMAGGTLHFDLRSSPQGWGSATNITTFN
jgi:hypothetical protein